MSKKDCTNCINCIDCDDQINKSYMIKNIQYTKEEYFKQILEDL